MEDGRRPVEVKERERGREEVHAIFYLVQVCLSSPKKTSSQSGPDHFALCPARISLSFEPLLSHPIDRIRSNIHKI